MFNIRKWLDQKLRVNVYTIREGRILRNCGRRPADIVELKDITTWHVDYEMVFDIVTIQLKDGTEFCWLDEHDDLLGILRENLREKMDDEQPNA